MASRLFDVVSNSKKAKLVLSFKSVTEEFKLAMMLRETADPNVLGF